jgi:hypothetical protein
MSAPELNRRGRRVLLFFDQMIRNDVRVLQISGGPRAKLCPVAISSNSRYDTRRRSTDSPTVWVYGFWLSEQL